MRVVFRCDASLQIGSGHVMRCLSLAQALRASGHDCRFICRDLPGHMGGLIGAAGFAITELPPPDGDFAAEGTAPVHAAWAGVAWQADATQTCAALEAGCDWLVMDHYAFDAAWQKAVRPVAAQVMVIDDLADRSHAADLLVDQNLGRNAADYIPFLPVTTERLIGPRYAMLRPEFGRTRATSLARRAETSFALHHLMFFMGGMDLPDVTSQALKAIAKQPPSVVEQITVVMGSSAPALDQVRILAETMPIPTRVLVGVKDMAHLMADADLAIGAAGGTAWERGVLGLPSLIVVLAENQEAGAAALEQSGAARVLGKAGDPSLGKRLSDAVAQLSTDPKALAEMSAKAASLIDGRGLARIVAAMEHPLHLRPATIDDAEAVWHWRQDVPQTSLRSGTKGSLQDHLAWFQSALTAGNRRLFMLSCSGQVVGHLRLDMAAEADAKRSATVSILLGPEARGKGLGQRALSRLADLARAEGLIYLHAQVHETNAPSRSLFLASGYSETGLVDGFVQLSLPLMAE